MQNHAPVRLVISLSPEVFCGLSNIAKEYNLSQNEVAANCIQSSVQDWLAAYTLTRPAFMRNVAPCKEVHS